MFLWFGAFSFKTGGGELNWPVTAYLSGLVLAAGWLARQLDSPLGWYRRVAQVNLGFACIGGLLLIVFMHESDLAYPLLKQLVGPPTEARPAPMRRLDPTCRLRGWRTLAAEVDRIRAELREDDEAEPVLAGCTWNVPGELGLYCNGQPRVFCFGRATGERHSQYDLWPNLFDKPDHFKGRTFIVVGGLTPEIRTAFASVESREVRHYESGELTGTWFVSVCRGFKGFSQLPGGNNPF
jgi:hypothetical protein